MSSNIADVRRELNDLRRDIERVKHEVRDYTSTLQNALSLAHKMGLPDEVDAQITRIQRLISILNSLRAAYYAVTAARLAAGDPLAYVQAGIAVGATVVSVGTSLEYETRGR